MRLDVPTLIINIKDDRTWWWTFAGDRYNQAIAARLRTRALKVSSDELGVTIKRGGDERSFTGALEAAIRAAQVAVAESDGSAAAGIDDEVTALKFAELVPREALGRMGWARFHPGREAAVMVGRDVAVRVTTP